MPSAVSDALVTEAEALARARRTALTAHHEAFKRRALDRYDRQEGELAAAVAEAIGAWLDVVRPAALHSLTAAAQPAGEPPPSAAGAFGPDKVGKVLARVLAGADRFGGMLDRHVMPVYARMLDEVLGRATDGEPGTSVMAWRAKWLADRRQALLGVPDTIAGIFRTALTELAERDGTNVDDAEALAQTMLDKGFDSWLGRARMIARTEVVGANNQGSLAAWRALTAGSSEPVMKTWLATEDDRTRPSHHKIDGSTVPLEGKFRVGSHEMNGPGDPDAPAGEVINCRCTLTYAFADGTPAEPSDLTAAAAPPTGVAVMLVASQAEQQRVAPAGTAAEWPGAHCTLASFDVPEAGADEVLRLLSEAGVTLPLTADAFGAARFNEHTDERETCAVLLVQSDELAAAKAAVDDALAVGLIDTSAAFPCWVPHVALAYGDDATADPELLGPVVFDALVLGWAGQHLVVAGTAPPDPAGETGTDLTAAQEADVTAPAPPAAPPAEATDPSVGQGQADLTPQGPTWSGPLALLDTPSSDGRIITAAGGVIRSLPLPLNFQREYAHGGLEEGGVVMVGRILQAQIRPDGTLWGSGDYLDPMNCFEVPQAMAQVEAGMGMVSVDLALLEVGFADTAGNPIDPALMDGDDEALMVALEWELGGVTIVSFPAFDGVRITNDVPTSPQEEAMPMLPEVSPTFAAATPDAPTISEDGTSITLTDGTVLAVGDRVGIPDYDNDGDEGMEAGTITGIDGSAGTVTVQPEQDAEDTEPDPPQTFPVDQLYPAAAPAPSEPAAGLEDLLASSEVRPYNAAFFNRAEPAEPTPLTYVPETGEVYGHLAEWGTCHVGKLAESGACVTAPHSARDYADFHLGTVFTDEGPLDVGKITVGTGHALPGVGFANAVAHYDNSGSVAAVVRAKDGEHGVWVCGQLRHDATSGQVEDMLLNPLSGDWRLRDGRLELCAALAVPVPGFPVKRPSPRLGMARSGTQLSLVAAGMIARPGREVDGRQLIGLPSGATIERGDFDALVAAAADSLHRNRHVVVDGEAQQLALGRARLRLQRQR